MPTTGSLSISDLLTPETIRVGVPEVDKESALNALIDLLDGHPAVTDLRGQTSPIQLAGAMQRARACVSVDSGPLHVAAAVGCPTVAIFGNDADAIGASPLHLWMPRGDHIHRTVSEARCGECLSRRFKNDDCVLDEHVCMLGITAAQVLSLLDRALRPTPAP